MMTRGLFEKINNLLEEYKVGAENYDIYSYSFINHVDVLKFKFEEKFASKNAKFIEELYTLMDEYIYSIDCIESEMFNVLEVMCFSKSVDMFKDTQLHDLIVCPFTSIINNFYPRLAISINEAFNENHFTIYSNILRVYDTLLEGINNREEKFEGHRKSIKKSMDTQEVLLDKKNK